ncbi:unnamed protein product [Tilletia laevis]|nr:hypothetical protein CF336_g8340 [Tilletia laevis]KAE8256225.1 hypothetical protein A4X03_0g5450 [Tilletia caries]KAE8201066.1 hypothetical protein CF335_g3816 [Tilletia laevis]CAD6888355.1 unnamed protein product [Tilletia caries]CAD6925287.1 unnamed protein product [Tilletia caries]
MQDSRPPSAQGQARPATSSLSLPTARAALDGPDLETLVDLLQRNLNLDRETATVKVLELVVGGTTGGTANTPSASSETKEKTPSLSAAQLLRNAELSNQRKIAGTILKLNRNNFVAWLLAFRNLIGGIPEAEDIVEGIEHDADFSNGTLATLKYDLALDKELGRVIIQTVDPDVGTCLQDVHTSGERRASVFFAVLRSECLQDDPASQDVVTRTILGIKQGNNTIATLVTTFRHWFTHAALIGRPIGKQEQVRLFLEALHPRYASLGQSADLMRSQLKKLGLPYELDFQSLTSQALLEEAKQKKTQNSASADYAFAVAFQASGTPYKPPPSSSSNTQHNKKSNNKDKKTNTQHNNKSAPSKGSNVHTSPGTCNRCLKAGHWARECRQSWEECKSAQAKAGNSATALAAIESSIAQATRELEAIQTAQRQQ